MSKNPTILRVLAIADLHWGAMNPEEQYQQYSFIGESVRRFSEEGSPIDLVVFLGDYFDGNLWLSSNTATLSIQWMHEFLAICKGNGVQKVRMIRGTMDHDHDQLESFRGLESEDEWFRLFRTTTYEETFPGVPCIYCPDETMSTDDHIFTYRNELFRPLSLGFFHGSFDVVVPYIVMQLSEETNPKNVIYSYSFWSRLIQGPLLAGHWHDGDTYEHLHYIGSATRWSFGEENPKGIGYLEYQPETHRYRYDTIPNPYAREYRTLSYEMNDHPTLESCQEIIQEALDVLSQPGDPMVRLSLHPSEEENTEEDANLLAIRQRFVNERRVKIHIPRPESKKKKPTKEEKLAQQENPYRFLLDSTKHPAELIQQFLMIDRQKDIPLDAIRAIVGPHLQNVR